VSEARIATRCCLILLCWFLPWLILRPWRQRHDIPKRRDLSELHDIITQNTVLVQTNFLSTTPRKQSQNRAAPCIRLIRLCRRASGNARDSCTLNGWKVRRLLLRGDCLTVMVRYCSVNISNLAAVIDSCELRRDTRVCWDGECGTLMHAWVLGMYSIWFLATRRDLRVVLTWGVPHTFLFFHLPGKSTSSYTPALLRAILLLVPSPYSFRYTWLLYPNYTEAMRWTPMDGDEHARGFVFPA
jgi:hypothetical protein